VTVGVDARARSDESLDRLLTELQDAAAGSARQDGCDWDASLTWRERAVSMSPPVILALAEAAGQQHPGGIEATSWAGHDAAILATAGVPAGMLFVRAGRAGVSHSPFEIVDPADIVVATEALTRALTSLAERG